MAGTQGPAATDPHVVDHGPIYLWPLWLRIWHWSNALLFITLIVTGLSMHFARPDSALVPFRIAVPVHNVCGVLLTLFFGLFAIGNLLTPNGRYYVPRLHGFVKRAIAQARYYGVGIFFGSPAPFHPTKEVKFNQLQQVTYLGVMYLCVPVLLISGWCLLFPHQLPDKLLGFNAIMLFAVVHYLLGFGLTMFLIGHLYLATTGHTVTEHFRGMLTGWHDPAHAHAHGAPAQAPVADEPLDEADEAVQLEAKDE